MSGNQIKKLVICGLCVALGVVLPMAFHSIPNAGSIFLPMHIPVLLCGLICGWQYGLVCGMLAPFLSSVLTGMPPMGYMPKMLIELAVYGLVTGICVKLIHTGKQIADLYVSLIIAMICGRIVSGIANALIFSAGAYTMNAFIASSFVTCVPGIIIQLAVIPVMVLALQKAGLVDRQMKLA